MQPFTIPFRHASELPITFSDHHVLVKTEKAFRLHQHCNTQETNCPSKTLPSRSVSVCLLAAECLQQFSLSNCPLSPIMTESLSQVFVLSDFLHQDLAPIQQHEQAPGEQDLMIIAQIY